MNTGAGWGDLFGTIVMMVVFAGLIFMFLRKLVPKDSNRPIRRFGRRW